VGSLGENKSKLFPQQCIDGTHPSNKPPFPHPNPSYSDMLSSEPPFDCIHVGAAADELHALLVRALAPGGRMVIPIGPRYSSQVGVGVWGHIGTY